MPDLRCIMSPGFRVIRKLLEQYPGLFRPLYDRICMMCRNTQEMMHMFSEELSIMDKNTVMLMIEEQQETIEKQSSLLREKDKSLREKDESLQEKDKSLQEKDKSLREKDKSLREKNKSLQEKDDQIRLLKEEIEQLRIQASKN